MSIRTSNSRVPQQSPGSRFERVLQIGAAVYGKEKYVSEKKITEMLDEIEKDGEISLIGVNHSFSKFIASDIIHSVLNVIIYTGSDENTKEYDFGTVGMVSWNIIAFRTGQANLTISPEQMTKLNSLLTREMNAELRNDLQNEGLRGAKPLIFEKYRNAKIVRYERSYKDYQYQIYKFGGIDDDELPKNAVIL